MAAFGNVWNESMNSLVYAAKEEEKKISAGFSPHTDTRSFTVRVFGQSLASFVCLLLGKVGYLCGKVR